MMKKRMYRFHVYIVEFADFVDMYENGVLGTSVFEF